MKAEVMMARSDMGKGYPEYYQARAARLAAEGIHNHLQATLSAAA